MGIDVGTFDPFVHLELYEPPPEGTTGLLAGSGVPNGRCVLDGMAIDCGWALQMMSSGAAVPCPDNDCGPRAIYDQKAQRFVGVLPLSIDPNTGAWIVSGRINQYSRIQATIGGTVYPPEWRRVGTRQVTLSAAASYSPFLSFIRNATEPQKPVPSGPPTPTPAPPGVDKLYGWWGSCNRSANDLMRTIRSEFSQFGNFSEAVAGGLGVAGIRFDSGPITQGRNIGITVSGISTIDPSISYSRRVSVTVSSASAMSFTFTTNPGHFFYPGTIGFSATDTNSGVRFRITAKGEMADAESTLGFYGGGDIFEDDAWKSFLAKVRASCGNPPK